MLTLFGVGAYYFFIKMNAPEPQRCSDGFRFDPSVQNCVPVDVPVEEKKIDFSQIEFGVPETTIKVKLVKGTDETYSATYTDPEMPSSKGLLSIDTTEAVDFSEKLVLIPVIVNSGGTGQFSYAALLNKENNSYIASVFIGDRISISSIETSGDVAKINFKTRALSQSYGDQPTIPAQVVLKVQDTGLSTVMRLQNSDYNQVEIKSPVANSTVTGEFSLKGSMPGPWYFEANSLFKILDENYNEIAIGSITALSDWMTEQRVPFDVKLNTTNFNYKGKATIIIESENVQGDIEGELKVKKMEIPFVIK